MRLMSFILNALQKAERDRLRDEKFEIEDLTSSVWEPNNTTRKPSRRLIFQISSILILFCLGVLIFVYVSLKDVILDDETADTDVTHLPIESAPETSVISGLQVGKSSIIEAPSTPNIEITGSIFLSDGSKSNRILIDDKALRTGDLVDLNWRVESIRDDGVVLRFKKHTVEIPYP